MSAAMPSHSILHPDVLISLYLLHAPLFQVLGLCVSIWLIARVAASANADPVLKPWPLQFHAQMYQNWTRALSMVDLWYDYPNGWNLNLIQKQLGSVTHDVEYMNGTSYYYDLKAGTCREVPFSVGIFRPDWLNDATYIGVEEIDGFKCNVCEKVEFIRYYEEIESRVEWIFTSWHLRKETYSMIKNGKHQVVLSEDHCFCSYYNDS